MSGIVGIFIFYLCPNFYNMLKYAKSYKMTSPYYFFYLFDRFSLTEKVKIGAYFMFERGE